MHVFLTAPACSWEFSIIIRILEHKLDEYDALENTSPAVEADRTVLRAVANPETGQVGSLLNLGVFTRI